VVLDGVIQFLLYDLPRTLIPRTRVNRALAAREKVCDERPSHSSNGRARSASDLEADLGANAAPDSACGGRVLGHADHEPGTVGHHAEEHFGAMVVRDTLSEGDHLSPQLLYLGCASRVRGRLREEPS
jgi:hypothetical protein